MFLGRQGQPIASPFPGKGNSQLYLNAHGSATPVGTNPGGWGWGWGQYLGKSRFQPGTPLISDKPISTGTVNIL